MNTEQILQLEPSPEADRAFAERLMGWRRSYYDGAFRWGHSAKFACHFRPTTGNDGKGDPACWWLGVERLIASGFEVSIGRHPDFPWCCEVAKNPSDGGMCIEAEHENPGVAVLRAGVQALEATGK